jgi:hypothetical protein
MSEEESYHNSLFYFVIALRALSRRTQVHPFIPWELQHDVADVIPYLLASQTNSLTPVETECLQELQLALAALPHEALTQPKAMSHPAWKPLRVAAIRTLEVLKPTIEANEKYFA